MTTTRPEVAPAAPGEAAEATSPVAEHDAVGAPVSFDDLLRRSDVVTLHVPLEPGTRHLLGGGELARMKPDAILVNTSRGALVDTDALVAALDSGRVAAAGLDVTDPEPLPEGHPFYRHPKVTLTPHAAWYSADHHDRLTAKLLANLSTWVRGEPLADKADRDKGY